MKFIAICLLSMVISFCFVSCGEESEASKNNKKTEYQNTTVISSEDYNNDIENNDKYIIEDDNSYLGKYSGLFGYFIEIYDDNTCVYYNDSKNHSGYWRIENNELVLDFSSNNYYVLYGKFNNDDKNELYVYSYDEGWIAETFQRVIH